MGLSPQAYRVRLRITGLDTPNCTYIIHAHDLSSSDQRFKDSRTSDTVNTAQ